MFAGHLGAGLLLKRPGKKVGLGTLFFSVMLLDFILWVLVLCGVESLTIPSRYRNASGLRFDFPVSHSLVASVGWSIAGFLFGWVIYREPKYRLRTSLVLAAAVFSHFVLDWLVHVPELPLAGRDSTRLGLDLWRKNLPLAWGIEGLLVMAGLWFFLETMAPGLKKRLTLVVVMFLLLLLTVMGQASSSPPPGPVTMAVTSLITIGVVAAFGWWVDREGEPRNTNPQQQA